MEWAGGRGNSLPLSEPNARLQTAPGRVQAVGAVHQLPHCGRLFRHHCAQHPHQRLRPGPRQSLRQR